MDVVRVSNSININEQQQQQQQPQQQSSLQLQTPQQQNFNLQNGSAKFGKPPRNGLKSSTVTPGSTGSLDGGTGGGLLHQVSASSGDSGNSSCVSGGTAGPDDPETRKNETGLSASASAECEVQVTKVSEEDHDQEEEDERQSLLQKTAATPSLKKTANIYVNKTYDEGLGGPRGSSTETEDFREEEPEVTEDVKPLLLENEKRKPPKSIVKSPSNLSFGAKELNGGQRPRLNLQFQQPVESVICDRPVHHVQFSKQQDNGYCYQPEQHQDQHGNDGTNGGGGGGAAVCGSPVGSILSRASGGSSTSSGSSSSNESSAYAEARPPDGGWGWVVCFASFMVNLIADGVTFSFGVLYVELLNYFGEGKGKTAWVGSLFMAMPLLSGPIASFLTDRYGCRNVTIVGSILASLGFALSAYANTIEMLYLTFGVLAGFGLSLCYVAAVVIVAYYFDKKRSFATGLSVCGSGIGTCIFATATQILLDEYGWRGTTLILAGIFLNMCLCGLLMRDLEWTTHKSKLKRKQQQQKEADSYSVSNSTNTGGTGSNLNAGTDATVGAVGGQQQIAHQQGDPEAALLDPDDPRLFSSLISFPTFIKNGEKVPYEVLELLYKHRNVHEHVLQNYPNLLHSRSFSEPLAAAATTGGGPKSNELSPEKTAIINPEQREPLERRDHHAHHRANQANLPPGDDLEQAEHPFLRRAHSHRPTTGLRTPTTAYLKDLRMHRHSLTYRGAMLNIQRYRLRASSCPDIYRNSMTTIAKEKTAWYQGIDEFKTLLVSILDLSYFRDVHFLLFAISNFLLYTWYDVPYVYLTDNATEMGFSPSQSSMLISIIGIVNMVGEIVLGWMGDRKSVNPNTVYAVCMGLCGLVTALVPLFSDYLALSVLAGAFGLFIAANYSLTSIILVELITLERFTNAYGLLLLVQGVANLVGPPLAGWISDMTQNYNLSFYLAGLFIALSGLLLFVLPAIGKYKKFNQRRTSKQKQQQQQGVGGGGTGAGAGTGIDCYGMDHLTRLPPGSKHNGTSVLITDCFAQEKLLKEGANV